MNAKFLAASLFFAALCACDKPASPAPTTQDRIKQDLKQAGENLKSAARESAEAVKPTLNEAKDAAQNAVHTAAEKVADWTETRPK